MTRSTPSDGLDADLPTARRPAGTWRGWWAWARARDVALGYSVVVVWSAAAVFLRPAGESAQIVLSSSTNLHNLADRPLRVLFLSAFVVSSPWGLWLLPFVFWAYAVAQRWVGRTATVLVAASGHVFGSVMVAVLLLAGIAHEDLERSVAREPDVGVSYGLASLAGFLLFRLPTGRRRLVGATATAALVGLVVASRTFTDLGHLIAWGTGTTLGFVGRAMAPGEPADRADRADPAARA